MNYKSIDKKYELLIKFSSKQSLDFVESNLYTSEYLHIF